MNQQAKNYNHVQFLDLKNNGVELECVVLREFDNGDVAYINLSTLDQLDLDRLSKIIYRPNAHMFPLYELMNQTTLANGENALEYFDQMVTVKTVTGEHIAPRSGRRGSVGNARLAKQSPEQPAKRGPGRPPKNAK